MHHNVPQSPGAGRLSLISAVASRRTFLAIRPTAVRGQFSDMKGPRLYLSKAIAAEHDGGLKRSPGWLRSGVKCLTYPGEKAGEPYLRMKGAGRRRAGIQYTKDSVDASKCLQFSPAFNARYLSVDFKATLGPQIALQNSGQISSSNVFTYRHRMTDTRRVLV